ncbi:MAG: arsenic resistance N-acetyltransferase ArsN2 [Bacteroidota bacterium]
MQIEKANNYRDSMIRLLEAEELPVADLPEDLANFLIARHENEVVGAVGLEIHGNFGLLRSLAVHPDFRNQGIAGKLMRRIDALSSLTNLTDLFLLTETAMDYFIRKGYEIIDRQETPEAIKQSSEFRHVCPVSAIVMRKAIS